MPTLDPYSLSPRARYDPPSPEPPQEYEPTPPIPWGKMSDIPSPMPLQSPTPTTRRMDGINLETGETFFQGHNVVLSNEILEGIRAYLFQALANEYFAKAQAMLDAIKPTPAGFEQVPINLTPADIPPDKPRRSRKKIQ